MPPAVFVVCEDGPGNHRGGRDAAAVLQKGFHTVGGEDLQHGVLRLFGKGVGVLAQMERPVNALFTAVIADGLGDRKDVRLREGAVEGGAPVAARAETDQLVLVSHVRHAVLVLMREARRIRQQFLRGLFACEGRNSLPALVCHCLNHPFHRIERGWSPLFGVVSRMPGIHGSHMITTFTPLIIRGGSGLNAPVLRVLREGLSSVPEAGPRIPG